MCGFAGVLDVGGGQAVSIKTLEAMARAMAHRGPDDEGFYLKGNLGLAHRRLAIIDPTPAGHQPMVSEDGRVAVVFNGTVYNFLELRSLLQAKGHRFVSRCDTEVLVHGWEEWGEELVPRLNGHFAFAAWDEARKRLSLVRDRFGTKPLYFARVGGLYLFASEIKAILAHPAYHLELNHQALVEYFTFQNLFRYHTLFKGVQLLPAANILAIEGPEGRLTRQVYWDFDFSHPDPALDPEEAKRETRRLLIQAVRRQLVSDVPLGAYLSGGVDSGGIVAIASKDLPHLHTFTCGWHMGAVQGVEQSFDERVAAEAMADLFHTEHYEQVVGHADVAWVLPELIRHLEDLRLGMCYGQYYIARLASKFVKVCLAGTGGDELFGGYPWRYYRVAHSLGKEEYFDNYYRCWQRLVPDHLQAGFFTEQTLRGAEGDRDMKDVLQRVFRFHNAFSFSSPEDQIANSLYFECKTFLQGLLIVGDRLSMAHGLEERMPFLDNDLVDFAQKIPVRHKLRDLEEWKRQDENVVDKKKQYFRAYSDGKNVLRRALDTLVPQEVLKRRKQGFSSPDESWYRGGNLLYVVKTLLSQRALCHDFIAPRAIQRAVEEHFQGGANHRLLIWSLLCFETWLRTFAAGGEPAPPRGVVADRPSGPEAANLGTWLANS